jgi:hypothetical protein
MQPATNDEVLEKIAQNWETFCKLLQSTSRAAQLQPVLDHFEQRLAVCPASSKLEYHNAFPGGLVDHSLRVLKNFNTLQKSYKMEFPRESVIIASLFHDFGKCGDKDEDYYLEQDSEYYFKQGNVYKYNNAIKYMTVPQRGLFVLQQFGVQLTYEEYLGILLNDGQYIAENKPYAMKEPMFSLMLHQADALSTMQEKGRKSILDEC